MSTKHIVYTNNYHLNPPAVLMDKNTRRDAILRDLVEHPDNGSPAVEAVHGNSGYYELEILHPALAEWLSQNGYTYEHHHVIPDVGIVDFLAKRDNEILVADAKVNPKNLSRSLTQISDYRFHISRHAKAAIALPLYTITDKSRIMCKKRKIDIIALDIVERTDGTKAKPARPPMPSSLWIDWYEIYGGCDTPMSEWTDVDHHQYQQWRTMQFWMMANS